MIKRMFVLSFALIALLAAPAGAQYATPGGTAVAGESSIRVTGEGCPPNGEIAYSYSGPESGSGTATADASGDYDFTIDDLDEGDYTVTVECGGETFVLNATVGAGGATPGVTPAPGAGATAGAGALPRTGTDTTTTLAQFGAAAVALGALAVYGAKRRKTFA